MKHILILAAVMFGLPSLHAAELRAGTPLPALASLLPDASLPKTAGKVVLVDFWASWCAPCKSSFSAMARLHEKYASKGLVIIAIGVDDEAADFRSFAAKNPVAFTLAHDTRHQAAEFFNPPTMPSSYLVDRKGVIRHVHKGFKAGKTESEYAAEIEALLAE